MILQVQPYKSHPVVFDRAMFLVSGSPSEDGLYVRLEWDNETVYCLIIGIENGEKSVKLTYISSGSADFYAGTSDIETHKLCFEALSFLLEAFLSGKLNEIWQEAESFDSFPQKWEAFRLSL